MFSVISVRPSLYMGMGVPRVIGHIEPLLPVLPLPHRDLPGPYPTPCSNLFTCGPRKLPIGKQAVGLRLKGLLVIIFSQGFPI